MKLQRNDQCPCSSGKKYKKCCYTHVVKSAEITRAAALTSNWDELAALVAKPLQVYRLKVTLDRMGLEEMEEEISRTVEILEWDTLHELHEAIQEGFDWDNDHLYAFYFGGKLFDSANEYSGNPFGEPSSNSKSAPAKEIRDLNLNVNSEFLYLFDFGDELVHTIKVEAIREQNDSDDELPVITNKVGAAQEQYPEWE